MPLYTIDDMQAYLAAQRFELAALFNRTAGHVTIRESAREAFQIKAEIRALTRVLARLPRVAT